MDNTQPQDEVRGVGKKARVGLKWTLVGTVGTNLVRIVTIPILGRLLTPGEFGAVAAALTVIAFGQMLRDIGIGAALIQRKSLRPEQIRAASAFSIVLGGVLGVAAFLTAPLVAEFYEIDDLDTMIRALAVMFVVRGFGSVSRALCQRDLQFRGLSILDFGAYAVGAVTSVVLAAAGAGVWSLVIGYLVESTVATVGVIVIARAPITLALVFRDLRELLGFGTGTTLADIASYFANNGDYLVVGSSLGKEALGLYTRAYELMRFPSAVFTNVARFVLFSAFSRLQDDPERLGRAFRRGTFLTAVGLLPASGALIVVAPEVILVLLGQGWEHAVLPFQILSVSMMARTSWKIGGTLARATGDVFAVAAANVAYGVLIVVGALIGSHWGVTGVAVAVSIECTIHYVVYSYLGVRRTTLSLKDCVVVHLEGLVATIITLGLVFPVTLGLRAASAPPIAIVAAAGLAGVVGLAISAWSGKRRRQHDWMWLLDAIRGRLQGRAKPKKSTREPRDPD